MQVKQDILDLMDYLENTYKDGPDNHDQFGASLTHWQMGFLMGLINKKIVEIQDAS